MTKNAIIIGAGASGAVAVGAFAIAKIFGNKQNSGKPFGREDLVAVPVQKNTSFGSSRSMQFAESAEKPATMPIQHKNNYTEKEISTLDRNFRIKHGISIE